MKAPELIGNIDERHRLHACLPADVPIGPVRLIVLLSEEDQPSAVWTQGIATDWAGDLRDPRQEVYTCTMVGRRMHCDKTLRN